MLPLIKSNKPRGRPKKAKAVQSSFALGGQLTEKLSSSLVSTEKIEAKTPIKNENPNQSSTNKKPLRNEN